MDPRKASDLQDELAQLRRENEKLESEKLLQRDEIRALKAGNLSYQNELQSLSDKVENLEKQTLQETLAGNIGKEVRLRYLERHRQRLGRSIGNLGYDRIKRGDRAAHRGRPAVDALLCLTGLVTDREVYRDLYGVSPETMRGWKDVPEMIQISGFRASLQSEGRLSRDFQVGFERVLEAAKNHLTPRELRAAFRESKILQQLQDELQNCYDRIVAANPRGRQDSSSQQNP